MDNLKKNALLGVLVVGIVSMTIAFAALSTRLNISGTTEVPDVSWNIHFNNWQLNTAGTVTYGGNTHQNTAVYPSIAQLQQSLSPNITLVQGVNITLNQPGDYAKYTFEIVNDGSIDASLDNFTPTMTCANGKDCSFLTYEVKCFQDTTRTTTEMTTSQNKDLAKSGGKAYCYLSLTYNDQTNQNSGNAGSTQTYTQEAVTATLGAQWTWIQKQEGSSQSGAGEQGGESGGNEEPETVTFNKYYGDGATSGTNALDNNWEVWIQENTTSGHKEVCHVFKNGTVCIRNNIDGFENDFSQISSTDEYTVSGYVAAKKAEFEAAGATCTTLTATGGGELKCAGEGWDYCSISANGYVSCGASYPFQCSLAAEDGNPYCG